MTTTSDIHVSNLMQMAAAIMDAANAACLREEPQADQPQKKRQRRAYVVIDFNVVEPSHEPMHKRLEEWGRFLNAGRDGIEISPMFELYRPDNWEREAGESGPPIDGTAMQRLHDGVLALPIPHRVALTWFYVTNRKVDKACRNAQTTIEGLVEYTISARQMLIDRRI